MAASSRFWSGVLAVALAGGLLTAAALPAGAAARTTPTISIAAASKMPVVTGDVFVNTWPRREHEARIFGTVTGDTSGDIVALLAQRFPFRKAPVVIQSHDLLPGAATAARYSFTVLPDIATRYRVELLSSGAPHRRISLTAERTVYVSWGGYFTPRTYPPCPAATCHIQSRLHLFFPASAARFEAGKHWYDYLGVRVGPGLPAVPKWLTLRHKNFYVSKPRRVSSTEFELTIRFSFWKGLNGYRFAWDICTKDTESRDGFGLPGHHGCGASRVAWATIVRYLG